jgi:hypothetical protein
MKDAAPNNPFTPREHKAGDAVETGTSSLTLRIPGDPVLVAEVETRGTMMFGQTPWEDVVAAAYFIGQALVFGVLGAIPHVWYHRHDHTPPLQCPDCGAQVENFTFKNDDRESMGKARLPDFVCKNHCGWHLKSLKDQDDDWSLEDKENLLSLKESIKDRAKRGND